MISLNPLTWFKAGDKAADAALSMLDGVKSGIDMLVLTPEEKIVYHQKGMELYLDHQRLNMDQNSERSKARREMAKALTYFMLFAAVAISLAWKLDPEWAEFMKDTLVDLKIAWAFAAAIVFYFGYYGVQGVVSKIKGK